MNPTPFQKVALGIAGITALSIGVFIAAAPHAFYSSYGIALGSDPNLLSELRAPATNLAALGAVTLAGIFRRGLLRVSSAVALVVFFAFPIGRVVSLLVDGMPATSVVGALLVEFSIGVLCAAAFWPRLPRRIPEARGTHPGAAIEPSSRSESRSGSAHANA